MQMKPVEVYGSSRPRQLPPEFFEAEPGEAEFEMGAEANWSPDALDAAIRLLKEPAGTDQAREFIGRGASLRGAADDEGNPRYFPVGETSVFRPTPYDRDPEALRKALHKAHVVDILEKRPPTDPRLIEQNISNYDWRMLKSIPEKKDHPLYEKWPGVG